MKHTILASLLTVLALSLTAQQAMPVIIISSKGKICYKSPDKKKQQKVITGAVLKRDGDIKLRKNSAVTFYCDGKFVDKADKGQISLNEVFPQGSSNVKRNFDLSFGDYTVAAFMMAASTMDQRDGWGIIDDKKGTGDGWGIIDDKKGTGDGWGIIDDKKGTGDGWGIIDDKKGTGDGWGGKGTDVTAIQPFGIIFPGKMRFYWSKPAGNDAFHVEIRDKDNNLILENTTKDTFWIVDLTAAGFKTMRQYDWTVETVKSKSMRSNTMTFEIGKQSGRDEALMAAQNGDLFAKSPEEVQLVMQAVSLEKEGWFEEASRLYQQAQDKDPKNDYVKLMHSAFWVRCGLKAKAREVYQ